MELDTLIVRYRARDGKLRSADLKDRKDALQELESAAREFW